MFLLYRLNILLIFASEILIEKLFVRTLSQQLFRFIEYSDVCRAIVKLAISQKIIFVVTKNK